MSFIGFDKSSIISSLKRLVSGTSAVGIIYKFSPSILNKSSSNLGSCPVPVIVSLFTIRGTQTSSNPHSLLWSKKKLISALSSLAASFFITVNLLFASFTPLAKSSHPKFSPSSSCDFTSKSNFGISPHFLISTLSFSSFPIGTSSSGIFGMIKAF